MCIVTELDSRKAAEEVGWTWAALYGLLSSLSRNAHEEMLRPVKSLWMLEMYSMLDTYTERQRHASAIVAVSCWQTGEYWLTRGKKPQLSFPHNGTAQTEGKECTVQIFTCCQPGFLSLSSLKHLFSHLCKILSFLSPAGKCHVITVVPKQDKEEEFKIGPQNFDPRFCVLCAFSLWHCTDKHEFSLKFSLKSTFDSGYKHDWPS